MKSIAVLAACLACATMCSAAPLKVEVTMTGGTEFASHPLAGANIQVHATWDPSTLTPQNVFSSGDFSAAYWPASNTTITMTLTGSNGHDGQYAGRVTPATSWFYTNNHEIYGDAFRFPTVYFTVGGANIAFHTRTGDLQAGFAANHFSGADLPVPKPFTASDAAWTLGPIFSSTSASISAHNVSGFAIEAPEPSAAVIAMSSAVGLAAFRRRR